MSAATVGLLSYSIINWSHDAHPPARVPVASPAPSATPKPSPAVADQPFDLPLPRGMDAQGFVDQEGARCVGPQPAAAIGRTARSLVVVCSTQGGGYEYRGIRLRDGAAMQLSDVTPTADGFVARNAEIAYVVSPKELVVTSDNLTLARDPMVEYHALRPARPARPAPPPPISTGAPAKLGTPSTVDYPTLPVNARGVGDGTVSFTASGRWRYEYAIQCRPDAAVLGFISIGTPKAVPDRFDELRGDTNSHRAGISRGTVSFGPTVLNVSPFDKDCAWQVTIRN
ncbi:hypothetical protein [Mycobacterium sp. JS623]|uniref:hypothetical protein n=1 Tax=Mycobacterium sp. JS623 TaxID=212767 RepID=UPI0006845921|nr:hypothetical protein [Mycobacterium sp. JS623]